MAGLIRMIHYLNQFFGGIGGEERANESLQVKEGPIGPGRALQRVLREQGTVVATIIGGDNYAVENHSEAVQAVDDAITRFKPDVLIAGPAFDAGRYGLACGLACQTAQARGIPAVTAMHPDNPGVLTMRRELIVVPTGTDVTEMQSILARLAHVGLKLARRQELGPALEEGYLPRGFRRSIMRAKSGAVRAREMLEARMAGEPFASEVFRREFDLVPVPPPVADFSKVKIALVNTAGLVPKGNPDRLEQGRTTEFAGKYFIGDLKEFTIQDWETVHSTQGNVANTTDTNYLLPLRTVRQLESQGIIGGVHPYIFTAVGNGMSVKAAKRIGEEITKELKEAGVNAVLMVAT